MNNKICQACSGSGKFKKTMPCFQCASKGYLTARDVSRNYTYRAKNPYKKNLPEGTINKIKKVYI
jgi:DnaJ-class molecular chaperone